MVQISSVIIIIDMALKGQKENNLSAGRWNVWVGEKGKKKESY